MPSSPSSNPCSSLPTPPEGAGLRLSRRGALTGLVGAAVAAVGGAAVLGTPACRRSGAVEPDRQEVLRQTVAIVMLPTLAGATAAAEELVRTAATLEAAPSEATVASVRDAWLVARTRWKRTEAFSFGPADDLLITAGAIDAWPAGVAFLDTLIAEDTPLDLEAISSLKANMRGFPGTEHLLFDSSAPPLADERLLRDPRGPRRRALLALLAKDLEAKVRAVSDAWSAPGGYGRELAEAGRGSATFPLQRDGIDEIVTGLLAQAELMLVAKLAKPLGLDTGGLPKPELEEAPRSDSSLRWLEENLLGLQAVYTCTYGETRGLALADAVVAAAPQADASFRRALDEALTAVRAQPAAMRVQLAGDASGRESLVALHRAVQTVKRGVSTDVASPLGASIGFGYSDTD